MKKFDVHVIDDALDKDANVAVCRSAVEYEGSDYGYGNVREVIRGDQDKLVRGQNWDKFYLDNIISWWKRKATKRYETLKRDGRFRDKVELWSQDDNIQIIR